MPLTDKQFGEALRKRRGALRLSQTVAATRLGVTTRAYQRYEAGTSGPSSHIDRDALVEQLGPLPPEGANARTLLTITGGGEAASGRGRTNDGAVIDTVVISEAEVARVTGVVGPPLQRLRWLINIGDSNEPDLRAGERLYYFEQDTFSDAGYYAIELDGERLVKTVQRLGGGVIDIIPRNPVYSSERLVPVKDADTPNTYRSELTGQTCTLRVVGKVAFNLQAR